MYALWHPSHFIFTYIIILSLIHHLTTNWYLLEANSSECRAWNFVVTCERTVWHDCASCLNSQLSHSSCIIDGISQDIFIHIVYTLHGISVAKWETSSLEIKLHLSLLNRNQQEEKDIIAASFYDTVLSWELLSLIL